MFENESDAYLALAAAGRIITEVGEYLAGGQQTKESAVEKSEKPITLEEVRAVLGEISRSGKTAEMKALLAEFGASKLSDVDSSQYAALLQKAREVTNA